MRRCAWKVVAHRLEHLLTDGGFAAQVLRRPGEPESHRWPSDDFLILVEVPSIFAWQRELEGLVELCRPLLEDRVGFFMAPVRDGKVVVASAVKVFEDAFPAEEVREWPDLPLPLVDDDLHAECGAGLGALVEVSGVVASVRSSEVHDDEAAVVELAMKRANETLRHLETIAAATDDPLIAELGGAFLELAQAVEAEAAGLAEGKPVARGVAASVIHGLKGDPDDVFATYIGMLACAIEWDIDPDGAWSRFQDAFSSWRVLTGGGHRLAAFSHPATHHTFKRQQGPSNGVRITLALCESLGHLEPSSSSAFSTSSGSKRHLPLRTGTWWPMTM